MSAKLPIKTGKWICQNSGVTFYICVSTAIATRIDWLDILNGED